MSLMTIKGLSVGVEDKTIFNNLNLEIEKNTLTVLMGKNGTGKSSLAGVLMGSPSYDILSGSIEIKGQDITELSTDKIAKLGVFLGFQHPVEIPGVTVVKFIQTAYRALYKDIDDYDAFQEKLKETMDFLDIDTSFLYRYLNTGFSGGEKKRLEMLQLLMFNPDIAILDEPDSGLDIDAMKVVGKAIEKARESGTTIILITHYQRLLQYVNAQRVIVLGPEGLEHDGDMAIVEKIEQHGYDFAEKAIS